MMQLSRLEQETIITFNEAEPDANIFTHNSALIRRLEKLCRDRPDECSVAYNQGSHGASFEVPKKWIRINPSRVLSDEQRIASAERLKQVKRAQNP